MTKQEALKKIEELRSYVEELDKPKPIEFELGDVFETPSKRCW